MEEAKKIWLLVSVGVLALAFNIRQAGAEAFMVDAASGDGSVQSPETISLNVLEPNGGESLAAGSDYTIRWETSDGISYVRIEYATCHDFPTWITVDPCASNTGSYDWLVPQITFDTCLMRVGDVDSGVSDTSDAVFTIFECQKTLAVDLNADCYVDWSDLRVIGDMWLAGDCCDPNWCGGADLNEDEDVDLVDFSAFAELWLDCGNPYDPVCECAPEVPWPTCWSCATQCYGDADCSGQVYAPDLLILQGAFETRYPDAGYNPCADFDRDGAVDCHDLLILNEWWMLVPPADCPTGP
ncbi:MAG: hypothetical protein ACYTEQ_00690 [Planctomycetota bacterium]|jgi:hypothetical protein